MSDRAVQRVMHVFVGSPGGVEVERDVVRVSAGEFNRTLRAHGWTIEVSGWEDLGPASGRPQANINPDVDACAVFIGILWNRWGSPTGSHPSGFLEEWERVVKRYKRTGEPALWLYFKNLGDLDHEAHDEQAIMVSEFRQQIEDTRLALYKTFSTTDEFTRLIRSRLLDEILGRSGLTRTTIGGVALDWSLAFAHDPVVLIPEARDRQTLAEQLLERRPREAGEIFAEVAAEVEAHGFVERADQLRIRACKALLAASQPSEAITLVRKVLARHLWWMRMDELDSVLRGVAQELPPETHSELAAWRACAASPRDPTRTARILEEAICGTHAFPLDEETVAHWRAVQWRCLLEEGRAEEVDWQLAEIDSPASKTQVEVALLAADALRAAGRPEAADAWDRLQLLAIRLAEAEPEWSAWIWTRAAYDLVAQEQPDRAATAYLDAATRWSTIRDGYEQAALAFFSAQEALRLHDSWSLAGWDWQGLATRQRSSSFSFAQRARELENQAAHGRRWDHHARRQSLLRSALWCNLRAGLLRGVMRDRMMLARAHQECGEEASAVRLYCLAGATEGAAEVASDASDRLAVIQALDGSWPPWSTEARMRALTRVGRSAPADLAARLAADAVAALEMVESRSSNLRLAAAEALAALALAVQEPNAGAALRLKLIELARDEHFSIRRASREALRMLSDVGVHDADDFLIGCFATTPEVDEPDLEWISNHLDRPARVSVVRAAALTGHRRALLALILADQVRDDPVLVEHCARVTDATLSADLGMFRDGGGVAGLLALEANALIAAATDDRGTCEQLAEKLLVFALETHWPMVNRVSAVSGLWVLREQLDRQIWLECLRPLAWPEADLDEDSPEWSRDMWAEKGDLEGMALRVSAELVEQSPAAPEWLDQAIRNAMFDDREPLRIAAWYAVSSASNWFDRSSALHALRDDSMRVRVAAIQAWRRQMDESLPSIHIHRLVRDDHVAVRLALISLAKDQGDDPLKLLLLNDQDAYVRGIAVKELGRFKVTLPMHGDDRSLRQRLSC